MDVPHSLPENFGDGYLCEHNRIYRNIRKQGVSRGTAGLGGNSRWFDYMVFPLVNFDELINSKEIPYIDNYSVLLRLSQKHPKMTLPESFSAMLLREITCFTKRAIASHTTFC